jgi:indole-3-glycerol phosphate synthase
MRKDFLTDPYQVLEARIAGASGVLVIITMLSDSQITALLDSAMEYGMFVLLEGFDERDLERICSLKISDHSPAPILCGVNCRDLKNLEINFDRFQKLATHLPPDLPAVAESGIKEPADVITVAKLGYRAALIGSALMRSTDAARELVSLKNAGVETVREVSCS